MNEENSRWSCGLRWGVVGLFLVAAASSEAADREEKVVEAVRIAPVWAGHPVGFSLLTQGERQFVAYFDAQRRMTVAARSLGRSQWDYQVLPSSVGWDSHNGVVMALDSEGCLHVSGNMHGIPLIYFRSEKPHDIRSLRQVERMVGTEEDRCTYPRFYHGANQELIFSYRVGQSGDGQEIFNVYDTASKTWRRLLDKPLFDGQGAVSAYPSPLIRGSDGRWHICWMWRDTADCVTNHDVSYARSPDLIHWETAGGVPLVLPITLKTEGVIADPVPAGQGMINMSHCVGFDAAGRPIVSYQKYDTAGNSQIFNARWEADHWAVYQASDWDYRWDFGGPGSIASELGSGPVRTLADGSLVQDHYHSKRGSGTWRLDAATLKSTGEMPRLPDVAGNFIRPKVTVPGLQDRMAGDQGDSGDAKTRYLLHWATLPPNRDQPREGAAPKPSILMVYKLVEP